MTRTRSHRELRSIFERSIREIRRSLLGWLAGILGFCLVMLLMYPTVRSNAGFTKLLDAYPAALRKLFDISNYTSGAGYLRTEVFSFIAPLLLTIFAILWGSDLTAGEEERRTIDALLAAPVSRRRVVLEKWLALVVATLLISVVLLTLLGVGGPLFNLRVGWVPLSAAVMGCSFFALSMGSLSLASTMRR